jgi:ketosteroid isomerase-like protein
MSQENVEIVRRIYDAVAARDTVTPFELYAEDIVWDLSGRRAAAMYPEPISHGHEGVRKAWRDVLSSFGIIDFEVEELTDAGDKILVAIREHVTGRTSGAAVEALHFAVWTLAGGKVTRLQVFDDREPALEAAGLRDEGR